MDPEAELPATTPLRINRCGKDIPAKSKEVLIMKKAIALLTAICLLILALPVSAEMVGGWETVPAEAAALPAEAQAAFDKAMDGLVGANYTPVALLATQLVAGTNYCILCQITAVVPDAVPAWALVYIYADLQGNARITNIFELQAGQFAVPEQG